MQIKKGLKKIYVTEDFLKEVLAKRKALQEKLEEERKKGKIVFLKYDKLIAKKNESTKKRKKRETSSLPHSSDLQLKNQQTVMPFKVNRTNAFDLMRNRSNSLPKISSNKQQ
ncbi:hypothetical protein EVAR_68082_1 [Eumeta japonica]|uniref:Uncharacterized protein n=1 Tax=Eumeta variegata TaxID=151549 RepID=A0A4C1ZRK0_EUMVA|nr:hypothetical protein EVAR_68082_1 [Eumeta japonica]